MILLSLFQVKCERRLIQLCVDNVGDVSEFSHLLSQPGVDPNIRDQVGHSIIRYGHLCIQNVNVVQHGWTILCHICYNGRYEVAQLLIQHKANVNLTNNVS